MSDKEYHTLKRYAKKLARDEDDRDDLILQAYQESTRLGPRSCMPLLINFMKWRSTDRNHSFLGVKAGGKSKKDAWNYGTLSIFKPMEDGAMLVDMLADCEEDPLGMLVVKEFDSSLTPNEDAVAGEIVAGYTAKEIVSQLEMLPSEFQRIKEKVRRKAIIHLA